MSRFISCQLCSSTETDMIQKTYVTFETTHIDMVRCRKCGLVYLNPQPTEDEIEKLYSDDYFLKWYSSERKREFGKQYFRNLINRNEFNINSASHLLDIGCGMGFFLEVAREKGCIVNGVEISHFAAKHCAENLKISVHHGSLKTAAFPEDYFDVITAFDVLEHLNELSEFLSTVKRNLKKDGMFIVIVPNYESLVFQLDINICRVKKEPIPNVPEHLTYFSPSSLRNLLEKHKFRVKRISNINANDEGDRLRLHGNPMALLRALLTNFGFYLGKLTNRRDAILAVAQKI